MRESAPLPYRPDVDGLRALAVVMVVDGCLTMAGDDLTNDLMTYDYGHLTLTGSQYVGDKIIGPRILPFMSR